MESLPIILIVMLLITVGLATMAYRDRRSNELIQQWAADNGYRVLNAECRRFFRGPFFWTSSKSQTVYYVTFLDRHGWERRAYVRCGSWLGGPWSDKVNVAWEE